MLYIEFIEFDKPLNLLLQVFTAGDAEDVYEQHGAVRQQGLPRLCCAQQNTIPGTGASSGDCPLM